MPLLDIATQYDEIIKYSEELCFSEDRQGAKKLIAFLELELKDANLSSSNYSLFVQYTRLISRLRWVCLGNLPLEVVYDCFRNNFLDTYLVNDAYSTWSHLREKLLTVLDFDERNEIKAAIRTALKDNHQVLTTTVSPKKINEWIMEYERTVGMGVVTPIQQQQQFYLKNLIFNKLTQEEKHKVRRLLRFYERLKLSSNSPAGLEEEIIVPEEEAKNTFIINNEVVAPIKNDPMSFVSKFFDKKSVGVERIAGQPRNINGQLSGKNELTEKQVLTLVAKPEIKPVVALNPELQNLKQMLGQFPPNSIERKAIEEEIVKLSVK